MARPKVYDDRLRARLIASAAAAIAEQGMAGFSIRALAQGQGTSTNAVYTLFGGKDELVAAVVEEARDGFVAAQTGVPRTDDALADLAALGTAYREWALANAALYAVLVGGRVEAREGGAAGWATDATVQPLLGAIRRAFDEGLLVAEDDDPVPVAVTLWAGVHGLVSLETALWQDLPRADRDRMFADHLLALAWRWWTGEDGAGHGTDDGAG